MRARKSACADSPVGEVGSRQGRVIALLPPLELKNWSSRFAPLLEKLLANVYPEKPNDVSWKELDVVVARVKWAREGKKIEIWRLKREMERQAKWERERESCSDKEAGRCPGVSAIDRITRSVLETNARLPLTSPSYRGVIVTTRRN